ncbi:hypothetical protein [Actinokineospora sp. UTMC 2448]|uniref:hypothetical protein n=1 Tax=Actinokineospora sp. UTMC 2448 TaxID=2268449 RepID=UPI0021649E6D|nr:hypothetical protein [Actinokineospora sp. UTMC 2448]
MTDMSEWPIVVTNRCADACAEAFGLAGRDQARAWLSDLVANNGEITDRLPTPVAGRRRPSGHFVLVENVLILPLAHDRDGSGTLSWRKPRWARPYPDAKWWIVFDNAITARIHRTSPRQAFDHRPNSSHLPPESPYKKTTSNELPPSDPASPASQIPFSAESKEANSRKWSPKRIARPPWREMAGRSC